MPEWLEITLRVMFVVGMLTQAWRGIRQMRARGRWGVKAAIAQALLGVALLLYIVIATMAIVGVAVFYYGPTTSPGAWSLLAIGAGIYFWAGMKALGWVAARYDHIFSQ